MLSWIKNQKISTRLCLGLVIPIVSFSFFIGESMWREYSQAIEMKRISKLAVLAPNVSNLVHELQKERGRSASFIASGGRTFADLIPRQRQLTDDKNEVAKKALNDFDFSNYRPELASARVAALGKLQNLSEVRHKIDQKSVTVPQLAKYYTSTINSLLAIIQEMERASSNDSTSKEIAGYLYFLFAKEKAGLERAMGAAGFSSGKFSPKIYNNFVRFIEGQKLYINSFRNIAALEDVVYYDKVMKGPILEEVERMRKIALHSNETDFLHGITPTAWFSAITDKINLMKKVEDHIAEDLVKIANANLNAIWLHLGMVIGGVFFLTLVTTVIVYALLKSITEPLKDLGHVMSSLASGNDAIEISGVERGDEIGHMARSVVVFRDAAIEKKHLEAEAKKQSEQRREERKKNEQIVEHAVSSIANGLSRLAQGDLTARVNDDLPAAYGKLKEDFNNALASLEDALGAVMSNANGISSGTSEISQASDDLSRRTEHQAATLEETAAAVAEITSNVGKSAEGADRARQVVLDSKNEAEKGGSVVSQAIDAMEGIEKSSKEIGDIIGVIDEIAFQTNLLALNAGVEAARAGEAGRGFAVVASEVRALAQRSASAARQIKDLISTSTTQVDQGVELVRETGIALEQIMAGVNEINSVVSEIAAGAQDQAGGLQQVNEAVNQLDQVTQENAAMVEEATAATRTLASQTQDLSKLVTRFKTNKSGATADLGTVPDINFACANKMPA